MNTFIGIDLGTSSAKFLLVGADGRIINSASETYAARYPQSGWSEQNPADWFTAVMNGIKSLLKGQDKKAVAGVGFGGQMHGLVALDSNGGVIRPCILWNDGRTEKQTKYLNEVVGKEKLSEYTANIAFAGFTAPKILWLKENEPENFNKICKILLPKDYAVFRLCGKYATDYSDASGTLLLDVKNKRWSEDMRRLCGVDSEWLPTLHESYESVGTLLPEIAEELGLSSNVTVCAGAGDNAAAAIGTGTVADGNCNISLGTSGTVFISNDKFSVDRNNALHSFCHANGGYHLMGCILSAASCNQWWMEKILKTDDFEGEQENLMYKRGENRVYFLPYLMGERSPHNDVNAKGAFIGMRPDTSRGDMTLAVMEGVAYALKDCVRIAEANGANITRTKICGGGAKSPLWRQIMADVMNMPVEIPKIEEGPSYGAAILAMVACGIYDTVSAAISAVTSIKQVVYPDKERANLYAERYQVFQTLYPALKSVYSKI